VRATGVGVGGGVGAGVGGEVGAGVCVGGGAVRTGAGVGVAVGVAVRTGAGVGLDPIVGTGLGAGVGVGVPVGVAAGVPVGSGVGVGVTVGRTLAAGVAVGVGSAVVGVPVGAEVVAGLSETRVNVPHRARLPDPARNRIRQPLWMAALTARSCVAVRNVERETRPEVVVTNDGITARSEPVTPHPPRVTAAPYRVEGLRPRSPI